VGNHVYVAGVGGLGVAIVDLDQRIQVGSIDLNAPALDVIASGPYVFVSTLGRFIQGFEDVHNEIAVIDTRRDPLNLRSRFTSAPLPPYGPELGPGRGPLIPPNGEGPYLSAFGVANFSKFPRDREQFLHIVDGFQSNQDNLPMIVNGALPDQMIVVNGKLIVAQSASDQIEFFTIDPEGESAWTLLRPFTRAFTNRSQSAFPTAITHTTVDDGPYLMGKDNADFFQGRMPQEIVYAESSRRIFVANRLGESVAVITLAENGMPVFERSIDLTIPGLPPFPATLAELGEDFYTSSRVSMNRDISCLSCHPDLSTDTKIWHVGSTPGRSARLTLTNRNLRDNAPYYRSAIRRNLEDFRGTFRVMSPEGPFGFFEIPAPFDANGDGLLNDRDRGRTVADVNRNRMFALERAGVGFEKTSAAIAAFLESEMRQLPNPFLTADKQLSRVVPLGLDGSGGPVVGDAVEGQKIFVTAGCPSCHPAPAFTTNEVLSATNGTMPDADGDNIPDGVTLSIERTLFDRLKGPWDQYRWTLPRERVPFTSIDMDRRLHYANTPNTFTPLVEIPVPLSPFSGRLLVGWTSDTRNVNVPSLRGVWELPVMLQHGRAVDPLDVLTTFNNINRHGDRSVLGAFDALRMQVDLKYLHLAAYLKSIE
jgi:cytochrome c peroxidase